MHKTPPPAVLLVDVDESNIRDLQGFFSDRGWCMHCAGKGEEGLDRARTSNYDIVISGLDIPDMDSLGLVKALRRQNPSQAILVVTKSNSKDRAIELLREGAVDYLHNPVDRRALSSALERIKSFQTRVKKRDHLNEHLLKEESYYEFITSEVPDGGFSLPIISKLQSAGWTDLNTSLKLNLAFIEALANSIEHGNLELKSELKEQIDEEGQDEFAKLKKVRLQDDTYAKRKVKVISRFDAGILEVHIKNEGPGFSKERIESQKSNIRSARSSGRGLTLISGSVDSMWFYEDGRSVCIRKTFTKRRGS